MTRPDRKAPAIAETFARSMPRRAGIALIVTLAAAAAVPLAWAQESYPSKPIKLVVGYPPGGSVDQVGRVLAEGLAQKLGVAVVIENASGAAGALAAARVASGPADGYTLLLGSSNELVGTGVLNRDQKYDAQKDFAPVGLVASAPMVLVAGPKAQVKTLGEFLEAAHRYPGRFSYGSSGVGSTLHFAGELVKQQAGLYITHIPYRGVAPLTNDLAGGNIEVAMMSPTAAIPFIQSGRIIGLGVTSAQRLASLPDVPALAEHPALKGYELSGWVALVAPRAMPADRLAQVRTALRAALLDPAIHARIQAVGAEPANAKEDLGALLAGETAKYMKLADFANMR